MPAFSSVFRVLVGVVLLVAAAAQHRDPPGRRLDAIDRYRMVPRPLQPACLAVLTGAEILLGAALIAGAHRVVTCIAGDLLFVCFAAAMAQALLRGIVTECGCFGSLTRTRVSRMLVARNAVVVVMLFLEAASKRPWVLVTGRGDAVVLTAAGCVALAAAALTGARLSRAHRRRTSAPSGPSAPPSSSSSESGARI